MERVHIWSRKPLDLARDRGHGEAHEHGAALRVVPVDRLAERGKRRIHKPPSLREMTARRPWLAAELRVMEGRVSFG
jgi:uracil-DNA glycosylase